MPVTPEFDFYALCAKYWNMSPNEGKIRVLNLYLKAGAAPDSVTRAAVCEYPGFDPIARMQPLVLDRIPNEARVEMLAHYGIVLGDS